MKLRGNIFRDLAEQAASHPRIRTAVMAAICCELPGVLEQLIAAEADRQGNNVLRMYGRRSPNEQRAQRDAQINTLLSAGQHVDDVAMTVGCSRRHVYNVRNRAKVVP